MSNTTGNEMANAPGPQSGDMNSYTPPGDTQVVSQSVYDSMIRQNGESMRQDFSQTGADGATLRTLHEGDSGHIDLLSELDARHEPVFSQDDNDAASTSEPNQSSPMAFALDLFPESQRFLAETPATAVKTNAGKGVMIETPSISRNPLAGDIESSGGLLGLSQAFGATQAPSSPIVHGLHPELASDRPSPNIPIQRARLKTGVSSPLVGLPGQFMRDSSEPNLNYISMKESQIKRDHVINERLTRSADNIMSDQSDKEFYKESSFLERGRRQRAIELETATQFNGLSAPARSSSARPQTSPEQPFQHDQVMNEAVASEEETEQEDDVVMEVRLSQETPRPSMEEDKENFDGPLDSAAATSAHDRLSQVLGYQSIASPYRGEQMREDDDGLEYAGSPVLHTGEHPNGVVRSSQVMVKDSQPSPQSSPKPINPENLNSVQHSPTPSRSRIHLSPRERLQSSPPLSRPASRHSNCSNRRNGSTSLEHITEVENRESFNENRQSNFQSSSGEHPVDSSRSRVAAGIGGNSSSMPSRVHETPVHQRLKHVSDMARLTSIPETSPSHSQCNSETGSNGDGLTYEDDDLPPIFSEMSSNRNNNVLRPNGARALSSPLKKLLSSPGGGQRRALTEIAADLSPQVGAGGFDLGIGIFTAEDQDFKALIDGSPTRPRKKRRGNNGSSYIASDPIIPFTPRQQPPKSVAPIHSSQTRPAPIVEESEDVPSIKSPETAIRRQSKPPRRAVENIWEVEGSPEQIVRRRSRIGKTSRPRSMQEKHIPTKSSGLVENPTTSPKSVIPQQSNPISPKPTYSEPTEISSSIPSDITNGLEQNTFESSPTTPRKSHTIPEDTDQIAPSQVLAVWMGQKRAYYPATCFGTPLGVSQAKYSVKFEDTLRVEVAKGAVKRFELRIGDGVKVDMPNVPKVTHVIRGFDDKFTREELAKAVDDGLHPITDIFGHSTVILGPKQRKSLPNGGLNNSENVIRVPIARVYLDTILWNQLKERAFTYRPAPVQQEITVHTPSEKSSAPTSPTARLSRSIHQSSGIFAGMAFAVSYKEDEASKNRITKMIMENGGTVLHEGFTELFEASSIAPIDTPTKSHDKEIGSQKTGLRLTPLAEEVGFACLIADTHSRREKYMQALALNLPCLAGRWIEDCISQNRVLDWDIYLLPAGESMYLNGATKSRLMLPTPPTTARLTETISARPKLLANHSVLLVMGRGKAEEKRKAYIFLTYALGASRVERVPDLPMAKALLDSQVEAGLPSWDWIYVDDADQAAAKSMLLPRTQRIHLFHGKKRKKSIASSTPVPESDCSTKVVGNEFVCQSLILGRLFE